MPTSSILIEFYRKSTGSPFDRSNYYLKIFLDDTQLQIDSVCTIQSCQWDVVAAYLESRTFKTDGMGHTTLQSKCFSHLPIDPPTPDNRVEAVPWWLALVISIPLAVITVAVIKIALVIKDKKRRERE